MIVHEDGTIVVGLDAEWNPVSLGEAVRVKLIEPDGTVRFLYPKKEEPAA